MNVVTTIALAFLTPFVAPERNAAEPKQAVQNGLKWLAAQQQPDGSWPSPNNTLPTTTTAFAGLALLMEGSTPNSGDYSKQIQKAIAWVVKETAESGRIGNEVGRVFTMTYTHAAGMLFLACAYDVDEDEARREKVRKVLEKAVAYTRKGQTPRGGWGYSIPQPGNDFDESYSTATVLQSLLATQRCGIEVPKTAILNAINYLARTTNSEGGVISSLSTGFRPTGGDGRLLQTATAATSLMGYDGVRPEQHTQWVQYCNQAAPSALRQLGVRGAANLIDVLPVARLTFALGEHGHQKLEPTRKESKLLKWSKYKPQLYQRLQELQTENGSWTDPVRGSSYVSSLALIMLQLENGYIPAFAR